MLQAQKDIKRARLLHEKGDYGFSAYSTQQALEKYLKAYIMKIGITKNPDNFKHLTYPKLFEEIVSDLKNQRLEPKNSEIANNFLDTFIEFFHDFSEIIKGFEKSDPKKILCWKESLGITSNNEDKKILQGLEIELNKLKTKIFSGMMEFFNSISNLPTQANIDPVGVSKLIALLQRACQSLISNSNINLEKELNELQVIVAPHLFGMKEDSISRKDSDFFLKFFGLVRTFQWIGEVIATYPHEEIGRYPIDIGGQSSSDIYEEQKEELLDLINSVELTCQQIKTVITHG